VSSAVPAAIEINLSSASNLTKPLVPGGIDDIEMADLAPSVRPPARRRAGRGKWTLLGGIVGIVVAVVVLVHPPWAPPRQETAVAPATAQPVAMPTAQPSSEPPAPTAPVVPAKATVAISLDSSPQDAEVVREDSGEVVGRTPLTIRLPQGHEVIAFRFEKSGHAATSYKVIPDLDKVVRADLTVEPASEPKHAVASLHRSTPARGHGAATAREPEPVRGAQEAPAAAEARNCVLSVASFPWTDLWLDGKDTGQRTPVVHYPVSCGAHTINLKRRDLKLDRVEHVTVAPGHELKQHYELSDEYGN
jgi:hypothetical protein